MLGLAIAGCGASTSTSVSPTSTKCAFDTTAPSTPLDSAGGPATIGVATTPDCSWTASSASDWISGISPASGRGPATVSFTVAANPDPAMREGALVVEGRRVAVQQQPRCRVTVIPQSIPVSASGRDDTIAVQAAATCDWAAISNVSWIQLTSASGKGDGVVRYRVDANVGAERTGTVTIAGQSVALTQSAPGTAPPPPPPSGPLTCSYSLSLTQITIGSAGGTVPVAITTSSSCQWLATVGASWASTSLTSGSGPTTVVVTIANNAGEARSTVAEIAGVAVAITQASGTVPPAPPAPCSYSLAPTTQAIPAAGGTGTPIAVTAGAGCPWTAVASPTWITITSGGSGTGNGVVAFSVQANTGAARNGTITVGGQTATVSQAAGTAPPPACSFTVNPLNTVAPQTASTPSFTVTTATGCLWTAASPTSWITVSAGASGNGNGTVTTAVAANSGAPRTGTLTIAGNTVSIAQNGTCSQSSYNVSPLSVDIENTAGTGTITVTAGSGCVWTAVSNAPWITIVSGTPGVANGTVTYQFAANTGGARNGTMTIAGSTVTLHQAKK